MNRRVYDWQIKNQSDAEKVLKLIRPYVKVKKRQIQIALKILAIPEMTRKGLLRKGKLADSLSSLNVRSKNRRKNGAIMIQERFSRND